MRRAGWAVWLAYDLPGSYEEMPPNLVDELMRDRRWCQGNLMNFRLFLMQGLNPAHRAVFMTGVMAYLSAPLWFLFLALSTALLAVHTLSPPKYFIQPFQLFPLWPEWRPERAIALFGTTAVLLFLPKFLSIALILRHGARAYGGKVHVIASGLAESLFSALLAPIRMLFHTQFVTGALTGWTVQWKSPPREDAETGWGEALRRHGWHTLLGSVWAAGVYRLSPSYLWWIAPIVGALIVSIPLSVYSSRVAQGRAARRDGYFLIPEELYPPEEIQRASDLVADTPELPGFAAAVADPAVNALTCAIANARAGQAEALRRERMSYAERALEEGPGALAASQKLVLMSDPALFSRLHAEITRRPEAARAWREAMPAR
jgi:membrane glycosyltransferase